MLLFPIGYTDFKSNSLTFWNDVPLCEDNIDDFKSGEVVLLVHACTVLDDLSSPAGVGDDGAVGVFEEGVHAESDLDGSLHIPEGGQKCRVPVHVNEAGMAPEL